MLSLEELFCPELHYDRTSSVELEPLWERGICGLILDLDNTLVPWRGSDLTEEMLDWARRARSMGFQLCIASNTRRYGRLRKIAEALDATYVTGVSKPRRGGFRAAARKMDLDLDQVAVIGDQMMTDILAAKRLGIMAILVDRIQGHEFLFTKINRGLERLISGALARSGKLPPLQCAVDAKPSKGDSPNASEAS